MSFNKENMYYFFLYFYIFPTPLALLFKNTKPESFQSIAPSFFFWFLFCEFYEKKEEKKK